MSNKDRLLGFRSKAIQQAARRREREYLQGWEQGTKKTERCQVDTRDVVTMCCLRAHKHEFGLDEACLQRVADRAKVVAEQFDLNSKGVGQEKAKKKLEEDIAEVFIGSYILPAAIIPKRKRDWERLSKQRSIADTVVKFFIKALKEVLGFGKDRTAAFVRAVEREYRAFDQRGKEGNHGPAREMSEILRTGCIAGESEASEPVFGKMQD